MLSTIFNHAIVFASIGYVAIAFVSHLRFCWMNPHQVELQRFDRKLETLNSQLADIDAAVTLLESAAEQHDREPVALPPARFENPFPTVPNASEVEPFLEPIIELSFEEMRQQAKAIGVKGWNLYKSVDKLRDAIDEKVCGGNVALI